MRTNLALNLVLVLPLIFSPAAAPLQAAIPEKNQTDEQAILQLELRAQQANPREQCFLYTELVSAMTELAGRQMLDGDTDRARAWLQKISHYADLIHIDLSANAKKLKNAQMLMHKTSYRLNEYIRQASVEDQATLKATLKQLDQVQDELLTQVFKK
jgi:hypothetical protein